MFDLSHNDRAGKYFDNFGCKCCNYGQIESVRKVTDFVDRHYNCRGEFDFKINFSMIRPILLLVIGCWLLYGKWFVGI
jgi:hypothetical protein